MIVWWWNVTSDKSVTAVILNVRGHPLHILDDNKQFLFSQINIFEKLIPHSIQFCLYKCWANQKSGKCKKFLWMNNQSQRLLNVFVFCSKGYSLSIRRMNSAVINSQSHYHQCFSRLEFSSQLPEHSVNVKTHDVWKIVKQRTKLMN